MPDRVKLPNGISKRYKSLFIQTKELQNPSSIARSAIKTLKKDIKTHWKDVIALISKASACIEPTSQNSLLKLFPDRWSYVYEKIESLSQGTTGNRLFVRLAEDAITQVAIRIEQGEQMEDVIHEIKKQWLLNVYVARFEECIIHQTEYPDIAAYEALLEHLPKVRPHVEQEIENYLLGYKSSQAIDLLEIDVMNGDL